MSDELELGRLLGRHEAFNIVAARCSAADAILLRDLREKQLYLGVTKDWDECCTNLLHMSRGNANRIIRILDEFGTQYFDLSQITRVSPETYRAIAPAVHDGKLHTEAEAIELIPENADKVAAAVAVLREQAKAEVESTGAAPQAEEDRFSRLQENFQRVEAEFSELARQTQDRERLAAALGSFRLRLQMMEREL